MLISNVPSQGQLGELAALVELIKLASDGKTASVAIETLSAARKQYDDAIAESLRVRSDAIGRLREAETATASAAAATAAAASATEAAALKSADADKRFADALEAQRVADANKAQFDEDASDVADLRALLADTTAQLGTANQTLLEINEQAEAARTRLANFAEAADAAEARLSSAQAAISSLLTKAE